MSISIIMPCYNAKAFVGEAVRSIQQQTYTEWECLIIDDCSTDGTVDLLRELADADGRIRPIILPQNKGPAGARNAGLEAASGRWVALLDADDLYAPGRLHNLVNLAEEKQADIVFDDLAIVDYPATGGESHRAFNWIEPGTTQFDADRYFVEAARLGNSFDSGYIKPLMRRNFLAECRARYDMRFRVGEDFLFGADLFARSPRCFTSSERGYVYRRHTASISYSGGKNLRGQAVICDEILAKHGSVLSPISRKAVERRRDYFRAVADLHDARVALTTGDWKAFSKLLLGRPRILLTGAAVLFTRLR